MEDKVVLQIAGRRIETLLSYEVEADIYQAADRFSLELANPATPIKSGQRCELYVNDQLELTGIIDATTRSWSKTGSTLSVQGRDLCGLIFDSCAEQFLTLKGKTVKQAAELLLKTVPFISRSQIVYQKAKSGAGLLEVPQKLAQVEPGMTVGEVLSIHAASRGFLFFALPDGTLVFGSPKTKGAPAYTVVNRLSGVGNNALAASETDDISGRYSKVMVISLHQGEEADGMDTGKLTARASVTDPGFPFYKPFVVQAHNDSLTPKYYARLVMERQRQEGFSLSYVLPGHSQNGQNFRINELAKVVDEKLGKDGVYLVSGRRIRRSKEEGSTTELRLSLPPLVSP